MTVFPELADPSTLPVPEYDLQLFIAGNTPKSVTALRNIRDICEQYLKDRHNLTVVDIYEHPEQAIQEELIGVPTLVKKRPGLIRRLVGDLSERERVLKALGIS